MTTNEPSFGLMTTFCSKWFDGHVFSRRGGCSKWFDAKTSSSSLKLIATDLDGTLLAPDKSLSPGARDAASVALERGVSFCLASGRPALALAPVARELFGNPAGFPCVCFNGALAAVMDSEGLPDRTLLEQRLPAAVTLEVLQLCDELSYPVQWCDLTATYNNATSESAVAMLRSLEDIDGNLSETRDLLALANAGNQPLKLVMVVGDEAVADAVAEQARAALPAGLCHVIAAEVHVEFIVQGCNKAAALAAVNKEWGISWSQVAFFGDNNNDVEALCAANFSFAMPNGRQAAKDAAGRVCRGTNAEGGVATEIWGLLGESQPQTPAVQKTGV